jgi:hypothetical protein
METMQYFLGILKIEKGKQKIINPEPTADKKIIAQGPFKFIAPVVSLVKRGAMRKDHSYFESIEQAEQIKEAEEKVLQAQIKAQIELQKQLDKLNLDMKRLQELSEKEKLELKKKFLSKELFKGLEEIPTIIRKKVG